MDNYIGHIIMVASKKIFLIQALGEPVIVLRMRKEYGTMHILVMILFAIGGVHLSKYEFSLRQEVLLEKGASVLGDLFRYKRENGVQESIHPISVMYSLVWAAKQDILLAKSEEELQRIEGQFDLAGRFLNGVEAGANA